ncbi:MAG TPA: CsbD family protein [Polyangia bacterium]|nr:CsbD family protein [Polyangia bacterium]
MNKDDLKRELKDKAENIKGRVKEAFGTVTGNKRAEAEGAAERFTGAAKEKADDIKRSGDRSTERNQEETDDE